MFDTNKIRRITKLLRKIPNEFDNVYIVPEVFTEEAAALFRRLKIPITAIMHDTTPRKETWGFPVVKTAEASANFNDRTALIILAQKSVPIIETTFDFAVRGKTLTVPAFVMTCEEAAAIYARVMVQRFIEMYKEDDITEVTKNPAELAQRFACGLTGMVHPHFQNFKYMFWDSREHFKTTYDFDDAAIVIQGPIAYDNNYTVETFKLYRSIYPNAPIVVSTWKGEATNDFRKACKENAIVLLENEMPQERGAFNVNLQLTSSLQGVKFIQEHTSAKFVLKTRTDQRINRFDFLLHFKNLLETFPPKDDKLHKRIIFLSDVNLTQFPFYYQDYLSFGHVEDISKLYGIPHHREPGEMSYHFRNTKRMRKFVDKVLTHRNSFDYDSAFAKNPDACKLKRWARKLCFPEMYISKTFYKQHIAPIDESKLPETSWKFAAEYLILIDFEAILFDWPKYEHSRYKAFTNSGRHSAFSRWLDMYRNFKIDWV